MWDSFFLKYATSLVSCYNNFLKKISYRGKKISYREFLYWGKSQWKLVINSNWPFISRQGSVWEQRSMGRSGASLPHPRTEAALQLQWAVIVQDCRPLAAKCDFSRRSGDLDFNVKLISQMNIAQNFRAKHTMMMSHTQLIGGHWWFLSSYSAHLALSFFVRVLGFYNQTPRLLAGWLWMCKTEKHEMSFHWDHNVLLSPNFQKEPLLEFS